MRQLFAEAHSLWPVVSRAVIPEIVRFYENNVDVAVEAYRLLAPIEVKLHRYVVQSLKKNYGDNETEWWARGVNGDTRKECATRREMDPKRKDLWYYLDLSHLGGVIQRNWRYFSKDFQQLDELFSDELNGEKNLDGDFARKWVERLSVLRNEVMHPLRGEVWDQEDFQYVRRASQIVDGLQTE